MADETFNWLGHINLEQVSPDVDSMQYAKMLCSECGAGIDICGLERKDEVLVVRLVPHQCRDKING